MFKTTALVSVALVWAGAGWAQEAQTHATDQRVNVSLSHTPAQSLFVGWQMSQELYDDALDRGADATEVLLLANAAEAAADAYEAALIAQNTVTLSASQPVLLTDEMLAELMGTQTQ